MVSEILSSWNIMFSLSQSPFHAIQGWAKVLFQGLVNFVPAVAYQFCLNLPAAFTQPGNGNLAHPCNLKRAFERVLLQDGAGAAVLRQNSSQNTRGRMRWSGGDLEPLIRPRLKGFHDYLVQIQALGYKHVPASLPSADALPANAGFYCT